MMSSNGVCPLDSQWHYRVLVPDHEEMPWLGNLAATVISMSRFST